MAKGYKCRLMKAVHEGDVEWTRRLLQDPSTNVNHIESHHNALSISIACKKQECFDMLMAHPHIDVNAVPYEDCPLSMTCFLHCGYYFDKLMAHPDININATGYRGASILEIACNHDNVHAVKALLSRPDLDVDTDTLCSGSLFEMNCSAGRYHIIKLFFIHCTGPATRNKHDLCLANAMIDRYNKGRASFKARLCSEMYVANPDHPEMYALMVCLSDGYFEQKAGEEDPFLSIAAGLPQELQMVLANRAYGIHDDIFRAPLHDRMLLRMLAPQSHQQEEAAPVNK